MDHSDNESKDDVRAREVHVTVHDKRPATAHAEEPSFFKANFAVILTTILTIFGAVFGYFLDTRVKQAQANEAARLALDKQRFVESQAQFDRSMKLREADLTVRRENLKTAKELLDMVPLLVDPNPPTVVEKSAVALASSGKTTTDLIVSMLGSPRMKQLPSVLVGLRVADIRSHAETCASLCAYAQQIGPAPESVDTVGNLSEAFGELRCNEARDILTAWQKRLQHPSTDAALKKLDASAADADPSSPCLRGKKARSP